MYILFDIGGSKMRIAASANLKKFKKPVILETPRDFKKGIAEICRLSVKLAAGNKIKAIGGGIVGPLDRQHTKIINSPNLKTWNRYPLKTALENGLKTKVFIENDTALVALGETYFGSGVNYKKNGIVAYITISTGVGGARIVDGRIDRNTYGFEIGFQTIDADGTLCKKCKSPGYLEEYISGKNVEHRTGQKPYKILDKKFWDTEAKWLSYGLNNTIVHWSPDIVILGGSMMNKVGIPLSRVKLHLENILRIFPKKPKLVHSKLGDLGGLYGSMVYLKQSLTQEGVGVLK